MAGKPTNEGTAVAAKKSAKRDDPEQSKRFLEAAREHGAAITEEEARKAFRKVAKPPKRKAG
jgi:hypothetical protein